MHFSRLGLVALTTILSFASARGDVYNYEKLRKNDTVLLIVDIQEGLLNLARDFETATYRNAYLAHSSIGKAFDLPVILTTSAETGPNGRLPQEITDMYPDAPLIKRGGEVDAWDNAEFREAVRATGRSQVIIAGIATDVCTVFLALSLRSEGYSVWANIEASATTSELIRDSANDYMRSAGVKVVSLFAIFGELMRDWRNTPGALELIPWLDQYYPIWGNVARGHRAAVENGTIQPGQDVLPL